MVYFPELDLMGNIYTYRVGKAPGKHTESFQSCPPLKKMVQSLPGVYSPLILSGYMKHANLYDCIKSSVARY